MTKPKRRKLSESFDDFDPKSVDQLRQDLGVPKVSPQPTPEKAQQKTKRLNAEIPEDLHRWAKSYAAQQGKTLAQIVIEQLEGLRSQSNE